MRTFNKRLRNKRIKCNKQYNKVCGWEQAQSFASMTWWMWWCCPQVASGNNGAVVHTPGATMPEGSECSIVECWSVPTLQKLQRVIGYCPYVEYNFIEFYDADCERMRIELQQCIWINELSDHSASLLLIFAPIWLFCEMEMTCIQFTSISNLINSKKTVFKKYDCCSCH